MRKLIAIICVAVLALIMAVPALANPSIGEIVMAGEGFETDATIEENWVIEVQEADTNNYGNDDVKNVVTTVNDPEQTSTIVEVVENLKNYLPENMTLSDDGVITITVAKADAEAGAEPEEKTIDLKEYDFVTRFFDVVLTDGTEVLFSEEGNIENVRAGVIIEALKGEDPENLENYLIMLINPDNGEVHFIELDAESFDPETGKIVVDFPCLGAFALIQK